tara:strand:+ start:7742 stop:8278 length:537 start_codon:yes stop_codon:yes gene_type:complete
MRTIETENVQFRRFVFASRRYAREKERALSSVIREREPFARVPRSGFKKSRGLFLIASSRPITHRARSTSRATSREIPRARARRDINLFTRARALSHPSRASPPPRATTASSIITTIDRSTATVGVANQSMDADARSRSRSRARATRDTHLSTSTLNVFSAIGAMIVGIDRRDARVSV